MKSFILSAVLIAFVPFGQAATNPEDTISDLSGPIEPFTTKVLKVYFAQDGEAEYLAYVVDWKGQEVVVNALSLRGSKHYKVGDKVRCIMSHHRSSAPEGGKTRLDFSLAPEGEGRRLRPFITPAGEESATPPASVKPAPER